jgi:hypothetical protein
LLIEHLCEPTQPWCPCGHALIYASNYFPKPLSWQTLLFIQIILFTQISAKIYFLKTKLLSKLSIYKKLSGPTKWSGPTILQAYVLLILIKGFQSPLRKLIKGDALSPLVSEKSTKALLLYLKTLFYLIMA